MGEDQPHQEAVPPISKAERRRRQEAVDYARVSVVLSGFKLDEETEARIRLYLEGYICTSEFANSNRQS